MYVYSLSCHHCYRTPVHYIHTHWSVLPYSPTNPQVSNNQWPIPLKIERKVCHLYHYCTCVCMHACVHVYVCVIYIHTYLMARYLTNIITVIKVNDIVWIITSCSSSVGCDRWIQTVPVVESLFRIGSRSLAAARGYIFHSTFPYHTPTLYSLQEIDSIITSATSICKFEARDIDGFMQSLSKYR